MSANPFHDCWFLTGPTASGKTQLGLTLAERLDAEIISLDSMAVYRRLDIGTAKPSLAERQRVPHHLVDLVEPDEEFSLAQYLAAAEQAVAEIRQRRRTPLFVGGTPLYLKALLRGIFDGPPADWQLRQQLQQLADQGRGAELHERLATVDPVAAAKLHPNDTRRVIRALEVHTLTGEPISRQQSQFANARRAEECRVFVLAWPKPLLDARIDARVEVMFAQGLVAEVEQLLAQGVRLSRSASQALGYREVLDYLAAAKPGMLGSPTATASSTTAAAQTLADTVALVKQRSRQFAKRQGTWFRSLSECRPLKLEAGQDPESLLETILAG